MNVDALSRSGRWEPRAQEALHLLRFFGGTVKLRRGYIHLDVAIRKLAGENE